MDFEPGTYEDLLADAARFGYPASRRLISDWCEIGLLDPPTRRGAGRGHGSQKALFTAPQRALFAELLHQRQHINRVGILARIPVAYWAYLGDNYVTTDQALAALRTSLKTRRSGHNRAQFEAARLVSNVQHPAAGDTAVAKLTRLLRDAMTKGVIEDPEDFNAAYRQVIDPNDEDVAFVSVDVVPMGAVTPTQLVDAEVLRGYARQAFDDGAVSSDLLETAREQLRQTLVEHMLRNPLVVALPHKSLADWIDGAAFAELTNSITDDLWLAVGALLTRQSPQSDLEMS